MIIDFEKAVKELKSSRLNEQVKEKCLAIIEASKHLSEDEQIKTLEKMYALIKKYNKKELYGDSEVKVLDTAFVIIDLCGTKETIAGATIHEETAKMIVASAEEGHVRFIEIFENGVKVGEFGFREQQ